MNQLPSKPRFYFAHRQAIRALIHLGVNALPFDPLKAPFAKISGSITKSVG